MPAMELIHGESCGKGSPGILRRASLPLFRQHTILLMVAFGTMESYHEVSHVKPGAPSPAHLRTALFKHSLVLRLLSGHFPSLLPTQDRPSATSHLDGCVFSFYQDLIHPSARAFKDISSALNKQHHESCL